MATSLRRAQDEGAEGELGGHAWGSHHQVFKSKTGVTV